MEMEACVQSCIAVDNYSNSSPYSIRMITIRIITEFTAIIAR